MPQIKMQTEFYISDEEFEQGIEKSLKNNPDFVLAVRCKDCKYYREGKIWDGIKFCFRLRGDNGEPVGYNYCDDDFCSYGERKDNERKAD